MNKRRKRQYTAKRNERQRDKLKFKTVYKFPADFHCVECGGTGGHRRSGKDVHPHVEEFHKSSYFQCDCGAYVLCHRGSYVPMGYPAGERTRAARGAIHHKFLDPLWRNAPRNKRKQVRENLYAYLAKKMKLPREKTHVSMFDLGQCHKAIKILHNVVKFKQKRKELTK